jgi:hypothetical protein
MAFLAPQNITIPKIQRYVFSFFETAGPAQATTDLFSAIHHFFI